MKANRVAEAYAPLADVVRRLAAAAPHGGPRAAPKFRWAFRPDPRRIAASGYHRWAGTRGDRVGARVIEAAAMQVHRRIRYPLIALVLALGSCNQPPQADLGVALKGIDQARFLACSGPPNLEQPSGSQDRMWFVTNLKRGAAIGLLSPTAPAPGVLFGGGRVRELSSGERNLLG